MLDELIDRTGTVRRMGSLVKPDGFASTFKTFEKEYPVWDDDEIRSALTHPHRRKMRQVFGTPWKVNQHSAGACNGWAAAGGLAKTRYLRGIQDNKLFSGAYLYSLMNGGQDNGSALEDGFRILQERGCSSFELVAWNQIYRRSYNTAVADADAANYKGLACYAIQTFQGFRTAAAFGYMIVAAVHAGNNFMRLNPRGISGVDRGKGNHSILIQDMQLVNGTELFDHDGSWGLSYGENGNSWLTADHFEETINYHQYYAIVSTAEGKLS